MTLRFFPSICFILVIGQLWAQTTGGLSLSGFKYWMTGHDQSTVQLIPNSGNNPLTIVNGDTVAHVKFNVKQYGEVSFPINIKSMSDEEPLRTDLTQSRFVTITYQSNQEVILQLRQTGIHGGIHNHVKLPATHKNKTRVIHFNEFSGGLKPLDLSDVSKFNFAFLANNDKDGFAELIVSNISIDNYHP